MEKKAGRGVEVVTPIIIRNPGSYYRLGPLARKETWELNPVPPQPSVSLDPGLLSQFSLLSASHLTS